MICSSKLPRWSQGDFDRYLSKLVLERLLALAGVTKVFSHFSFQCTLDQFSGEWLEQTMLTNQIFWFLVIGQQAVDHPMLTVISSPRRIIAVSCPMTVYNKILTSAIKSSAFLLKISSDSIRMLLCCAIKDCPR